MIHFEKSSGLMASLQPFIETRIWVEQGINPIIKLFSLEKQALKLIISRA